MYLLSHLDFLVDSGESKNRCTTYSSITHFATTGHGQGKTTVEGRVRRVARLVYDLRQLLEDSKDFDELKHEIPGDTLPVLRQLLLLDWSEIFTLVSFHRISSTCTTGDPQGVLKSYRPDLRL